MTTLSPQDKSQLQAQNENLVSQNNNLATANDTAFNNTVDLYPVDIPFKKILDDIHSNIYFYEDELKRLDGHTIAHPLQEETFVIYDNVANARIIVRDGRLRISENGTEVIKIPIVPIKGYSTSRTNVGKDFDIWSRDRHGSTTSVILSTPLDPNNIVIDDNATSSHRKLAVVMDSKYQEIDMTDILSLPSPPNASVTMNASQTASLIQTLFQQIESNATMNSILAPQFEIHVGDTISIQVNGSSLQTITFAASDFALVFSGQILASAQECINVFNRDWIGVTASFAPPLAKDISGNLVGTQMQIVLNTGGQSFQIIDGYGSPNKKFGFSTKVIYANSPFANAVCIFNTKLNTFTIASGTAGSSSTAQVVAASPLIKQLTFTSTNQDKLFATDHYPVVAGSYTVYKNQILLQDTIDYTFILSSGTLELVSPLQNTDVLVVNYGYISDLRTLIGYGNLSAQTTTVGKYQNNKLKVEIDGVTKVIEIRDFRACFHSTTLGDNNDDYGAFWSGVGNQIGYIGNFKAGPLFCSGFDDASDVASSIQAKLREIGSGGFKNAECKYYSYTQQFVIYSGTVAHSTMTEPFSSVHVLPLNEDLLRDARTMLGFDVVVEEAFTKAYDTLGSLFDVLNTRITPYQNISVQQVDVRSNWENRLSHSVLYSSDTGYLIGAAFQAYSFPTTLIYDNASRSLPRLYPNGKVTIDATNDKINYFLTSNVEKTVTIAHGVYDAFSLDTPPKPNLADAITAAFASVGVGISCSYNLQTKKFTLSGTNCALLFGSGKDAKNCVADYLGFTFIDKDFNTSHTSDYQALISNPNFGTIIFPQQFFPPNLLQFVFDYTVDERSALILENYYLLSENNYLNFILNLTAYDNEVLLNSWEYLATLEFWKVIQEIVALRYQRGDYGNHISESDAEIVLKTNELNKLDPNWQSLNALLATHGNLLDETTEIVKIVPSSSTISFTTASGKEIYNNPSPTVKYTSGNNRHITGIFSNPQFFSAINSYTIDNGGFEISCVKAFVGTHAIVSSELTLTSTQLTTVLTLDDASIVDDLNIDLTAAPNDTIGGLISTIDAATGYLCQPNSAKLIGKLAGKFRVENGDQLIISGPSENISINFSLQHGYWQSLPNAKTRITSNVDDHLLINIDNTIDSVIDEPETLIINIFPIPSTTIQLQHMLVHAGTTSGKITHLVGPDTILIENIDYYISNTEKGIITFLIIPVILPGDQYFFSYTYTVLQEIILGTQINGYDIAAKIQQEVRNIQVNNIEKRSGFLGFVCIFDEVNDVYTLISGSGGTGSSVNVYQDSVADATQSLLVGKMWYNFPEINLGFQQNGFGDFANSNFISITDMINLINSKGPTQFTVSGTTNLILTSTVTNALIRVTGSAANKVGFDIGVNDVSNPASDFSSVSSSSLNPVTNQEILAPDVYNITRTFENKEVQIIFTTFDRVNITNRILEIATRLASGIANRIVEIDSRVNELLSILVPDSLYKPRRDEVYPALPLFSSRFDTKYGSYKKIGDLLNSIDQNNNVAAQNSNESNTLQGLINS